jgi:hypothetical protein
MKHMTLLEARRRFRLPATSMSWARIAAFMPEPHILLTVVQRVDLSRPAPSAA